MLAASKGVVCVFVDLEWGQQHTEYAQRYGVRALPTVVYADSEGEEVSRMSSPDPADMVGELQQLTRDHTRSFGSVESSMPAPGAKGHPRAR